MNNTATTGLPQVTIPRQVVYEIFVEAAFRGEGFEVLEPQFVGCMRLPFSEIIEVASRTKKPFSFMGERTVVADYQSFQICGDNGEREIGYQVCYRMVAMNKLKFNHFVELLKSISSQQRASDRLVIEKGYLK